MKIGRPPKPLIERFAQNLQLDQETGCWNWTGYHEKRPQFGHYGRIKVLGIRTPQAAHRVSYELFVGPIPAHLTIDHICRNTRCVNPAHLRLLTRSENSDGGWVKKFREATHCAKGHPLDGDNLFVRYLKNGKTGRGCRQCKRDADTKQRDKIRPNRLRRVRSVTG